MKIALRRHITIGRILLFCLLLIIYCIYFWISGIGKPIGYSFGSATPKSLFTRVRLDSHEVVVRLKYNQYIIEETYHFYNTGGSTTFTLCFPIEGNQWAFTNEYRQNPSIHYFDVWVDGNKVSFNSGYNIWSETRFLLAKHILFPLMYVSIAGGRLDYYRKNKCFYVQAKFAGHSATIVKTRIKADYSETPDWARFKRVVYQIGTGAEWKDAIGKFSLVVDAKNIGGIQSVSEKGNYWTRVDKDQMLRFERKDFEPTRSGCKTS